MSTHSKGPWRWASDWSKRLPKHSEDYDAEKYADLSLYDANGKPVIEIGIDHYEAHFSANITDPNRLLIAAAPRLFAEVVALHEATKDDDGRWVDRNGDYVRCLNDAQGISTPDLQLPR